MTDPVKTGSGSETPKSRPAHSDPGFPGTPGDVIPHGSRLVPWAKLASSKFWYDVTTLAKPKPSDSTRQSRMWAPCARHVCAARWMAAAGTHRSDGSHTFARRRPSKNLTAIYSADHHQTELL